MTTSDTPDVGPPAKKRTTPTPLNDPTVRMRTRPLKPGRWHPRIAESTPSSSAVAESMGQPTSDVNGAPLSTAAAVSMGQPTPDVNGAPLSTATAVSMGQPTPDVNGAPLTATATIYKVAQSLPF